MNYRETLDYLYSRLPMFSRIGAAAFKKDLTNIRKLCAYLNQPHTAFKSIHVAGTNGKGSVSHMLAAIFQSCGYKTGLYTSPHLKDFRERIKINGIMAPEEFITETTKKLKPVIEDTEPSFFEISVALAFAWFAEAKTDIAVVEVGLGGRLDSTNIITPELSVITNIGRDHMDMLGDTLEKIAYEKAGIIKPHVPVVVGETQEETSAVFEKIAAQNHAPIFFADQRRKIIQAELISDSVTGKPLLQLVICDTLGHSEDKFLCGLTGMYQKKNILTVLEACEQMKKKGWMLPDAQLKSGLLHVAELTGLRGRWEVLRKRPQLVLDVAHNEPGILEVVRQIEITPHCKLHIVFGMVKDKDTQKILELLPREADYYFTQADIPRALACEELQRQADARNLKGTAFKNVNEAIQSALAKAETDDLIVVCGSLFVIGEVDDERFREKW
ncbi:MAG: bifunctional folylpolyglutamate synthase/dihydrofolate synthase [Chitinophagaceae bacterium]|nr:bifunctional folylpolyglutamate synthase/dihydrofolate synthase [Chitinophagaceae bacterium]